MIDSVDKPEQMPAQGNLAGSEKRIFSRVTCLMDLKLSSPTHGEGSLEDVEAIDLSLLGLGFQRSESAEVLPCGQKVTVTLPGFQPVRAEVRWQSGSRVGVRFCGRMQDIVESWVGEILAAQGVRLRDLIARL